MAILKLVIIAAVCQFVAGQENVCSDSCTTLGTAQSSPGRSCDEIYQIDESSRGVSGNYWINTTTGIHQVYCDMELVCGGQKGGWMRIADLDTSKGDSCPSGWGSITSPLAACRSANDNAGCHSTSFSVNGVRYHKICGQARGYQIKTTDAFDGPRRVYGSEEFEYIKDIDDAYVDGLSITIESPRKHVWTYASGNNDNIPNVDPEGNGNSTNETDHVILPEGACPCAARPGLSPFPFVYDNYYCESGYDGGHDDGIYMSDPLWDGSQCDGAGNNCCTEAGQPLFYRHFPVAYQSDVEARICADEDYNNEGLLVDQLQLFVM